MAEAAVTFLLQNVKKLIVEQIHLISGAENEMKKLQDELELMKAFLVESANKREKGETFRQFEKQIREVVYLAEDTLDNCLLQAVSDKSKNFRIKGLTPKRLDLAKKVKAIRERDIKPIFDRAMAGFTLLPMADLSATSQQKPKDEHKKNPLLRQDNVVGFDGEANTLIGYLKEGSEELEVISIIGMPGLGKTTLAWKIYRDKRIQHEFPTVIWVYVSQDFNIKEVFLTILKKFTQDDMSALTDPELAEKVRSNLENKKFLLIMDDVWTGEAWKSIEAALPRKNRLGKVLITSRDDKVARHAKCKRDPHKLRFLDASESWELLQLEVFGKVDESFPLPDLDVLGRRIANGCGGVPLAIVVIGGILIEKSSTTVAVMKDEWAKIADSVSVYLNYDKQKRTENIISLSYDKLPNDLRECFLYLGMFPEDTEIPAWKLIRLWIAEGFIQQNWEKSLEEAAEDNLKDLVDRNLVMVDKIGAKGDVKTCRVHDMIREFCRGKASFAEQNVFQEVKKTREGVFHPSILEIETSRRLCIHSYVVDFLQKKPKGPRVRSFLCFSKETIILPTENIPSIPETFNLLRVLDVNPIRFPKFPSKITQLIHLRYIALSGDEFKALPDAVSKLWNLQTIKIETMSRTFEIKADIWKMMQLRHLKTKAAITLLNYKDAKGGAGENLQTLSRISPHCCTDELFNRVSNLKNLGIRGKLHTILQVDCLANLDRVQKLKLVYDVHPKPAFENPLRQLPQPERFPPNLRILKLSSTNLDWQHMTTLGKLPKLEVLKLKENAFVGKSWEAAAGGFPSLEFLQIARTDLEFWTAPADSDSFPKLKCLVLKNCEKLVRIPSVLEKNLEVFDIERVTQSIVTFAKGMESAKQQMQGQPQRFRRGVFKLIIAPGDA